jgi:hypothetical protein
LQAGRFVRRIVDFGEKQVFDGKQTYTCITFIDKKPKDFLEYACLDGDFKDIAHVHFTKVDYRTLNPKKWRLLSEKDQRNILQIESAGVRLGKIANISTGIATLKDSLYFVDSTIREDGYYVKIYNGTKYLVENGITKEIIKVSDFKTQEEMRRNTRRIIFPYKLGKSPVLMQEQELEREFPKTFEYLCAIKKELAVRDKGKKSYPGWFAYGRTQGLNNIGEKILTPTFSDKPRFLLCEKKDALFCNGYGLTLADAQQLRVDTNWLRQPSKQLALICKILNSSIMDYYIRKTSYVIEGGFFCYQKQFLQSFSLPRLSETEASELLAENDRTKIDEFLLCKYGIIFQVP